MCRSAVLLLAAAVLAVALTSARGQNLRAAKDALLTARKNLKTANIATEYIYDRNPNVLTDCTNRRKQKSDSVVFTQYINGCVGKALGRTLKDMVLKQSLDLFIEEALATATTVQRLQRVTDIIGCAITLSLAQGK